MKKTLTLLITLCTLSALSFAQENCKLCGTWIGTFTLPVPDPDPDGDIANETFKMYIRVRQHGNNYSVRVKTFPIKETDNIKYWNNCEVTSISEESITFSSFVRDCYDWSNSDRKNGRVIHKTSYWNICTLTYHSVKLVLSQHLHTKYYDKNGTLIGTHNNPSSYISLYQDNDDW